MTPWRYQAMLTITFLTTWGTSPMIEGFPEGPRETSMPISPVRIAAATAMAAALAALAPVSAEAEQRESARYVSMGDSYVAGALTGAPTAAPFSCFQTNGNYPHLVAPALAVDEHVDVSCSSAKTDDVFTPQQLDDGFSTAPPQLDAVNADTAVVSLGFGGNDIRIREALEHCFSPVPFASPCRDYFVRAGQGYRGTTAGPGPIRWT